MKSYIWVVEMFNCCYACILPRWEPTVGVEVTRADARKAKGEWERKNPYDKFRIRKYVRQP